LEIALIADPEIPVPPIYYGGIERIINMLALELTSLGHQVTLFAHPDSDVPCRLVGYKASGHKLGAILSNSLTINKELMCKEFDIIHSFGRLAYLLPQLPFRLPKIMSYQREPTISQVKKAVRLSKKDTICFTGCSNYITDKIKPFAEAFTVYNGVDVSLYDATERTTAGAPLIFLGRIEPAKGTHTAIEIALKSKKKLKIAGNIPPEHQGYFNKMVKPFLSEQIEYVGAVNDAQKNELLKAGLALLMPIHWDEPFGIVMAEAMACGTPVLGFNRGAVPEVIENNVTGFYCETIDELAENINRVQLLDRKKIRQIAEDRFSSVVIVEQYIRIYQHLLKK
jgi:glycosyltransferase involved in cell wall biosynthesis